MRVEETRSKAEPLSVLVTRESGFRTAPGPADIPEKGRWQEGAGCREGRCAGESFLSPRLGAWIQAGGRCSSGKLFQSQPNRSWRQSITKVSGVSPSAGAADWPSDPIHLFRSRLHPWHSSPGPL